MHIYVEYVQYSLSSIEKSLKLVVCLVCKIMYDLKSKAIDAKSELFPLFATILHCSILCLRIEIKRS